MTGDLREGRRWSLPQSAKNAAIYALAMTALACARPLPRAWLRALGRGVGLIAFAIFARARRIAMTNVAIAFPELDEAASTALVRRTYATLGAHLGDAVAMLRARADDAVANDATDPSMLDLDEAARAALRSARDDGRGVVFASAHLGPWESVAAALARAGIPLTTIARESYDPRLTRLYDRVRGGHGVRSIYRGSRGAAARIVRTLRANEVLGVPMDLRSRVPSIDAPFLGASAPTAVGPARIALRTRAAVLVGTAAPTARGSLCVTVTRIDTMDLAAGDAGERALTTRINAEISRRIRAMPHAWPWMHDRFALSLEGARDRVTSARARRAFARHPTR